MRYGTMVMCLHISTISYNIYTFCYWWKSYSVELLTVSVIVLYHLIKQKFCTYIFYFCYVSFIITVIIKS